MALPKLTSDGYLPPGGPYDATIDEVTALFGEGTQRRMAARSLRAIHAWATANDATRIIIGGSFLSTREHIGDIDLVVVFNDEQHIPSPAEHFEASGGIRTDVFFAAETTPAIVNAFIKMFSSSRNGREVGTICIPLRVGTRTSDRIAVSEDLANLILSIYGNRRVTSTPVRKILVPIHGIKSHGEWYAEVTEICTADGWMVAPFTYQYQTIATLLNTRAHKRIVDEFRAHLQRIKEFYGDAISVLAHSFGTFISMKYLLGFVDPPVHFDTLILAGSILNTSLDLSTLSSRIAWLINEVAPNDRAVRLATLLRMVDPMFGNSGVDGFRTVDPSFVTQNRGDLIFGHGNVIRRDIVYQRWLPALNANVGRGSEASRQF